MPVLSVWFYTVLEHTTVNNGYVAIQRRLHQPDTDRVKPVNGNSYPAGAAQSKERTK